MVDIRKWSRLALIAVALFPRPASADQRAILELKVNGADKGEIHVFLRGSDLLVQVSDLESAGLRLFAGTRESIGGHAYVSLASLAPGVSFNFDERELTLALTVQLALLGSTVRDFHPTRPPGLRYQEDPSAFFNYALNVRDFRQYDAFGEMGIQLWQNLLYSSVLRNAEGMVVRGITNLTIDNRERLLRAVIGDRIASAGTLGGGLFLGGISISRDFSLDPYFVFNPTPQLSGAVMTPSTVDVYVNDRIIRREQLSPGPFQFKNLPVPAGSGTTRMIIRDAFGREQQVVSPFYFTTRVLNKGLHEFSYHFGYRRNQIATNSWDYGPLAFIGQHRYGFVNFLSAGMRFEATSDVVSGGPNFNLRLPVGEIEIAAGASRSQGVNGGAASLGYSYLGKRFNFATSTRLFSPHYATTNLEPFEDRPWLEVNALAGFHLTSRTNISLQYSFTNSKRTSKQQRISMTTGIRLTKNLSLFVTGAHARESGVDSNEIYSGLTFFFGQTTGSLSYQQKDKEGLGTVSLHKSLPPGSGFGYRFQANTTREQHQFSSTVQYQGPYGRYEMLYNRAEGVGSTVLNVAGGMVAIGGGVYLTRPVQQSFALIKVPGVGDVRGYLSNQEIGRSTSGGNLLVPNLLPYHANRLGIEAQDIPFDRNIEAIEKIIAPPFRGGAVVLFPAEKLRRLTGKVAIVSAGHAEIPAYGQLTVTAEGREFESPIGRGGEIYLENVPAGRYPATVEYKGSLCRFSVEIPASENPVVKLGEMRCIRPQ